LGGSGRADRTTTIVEVAPPTRPDLERVRRDITRAQQVSDRILVPENQLGRASLSSLVVAAEVRRAGARPIACLTARDRNLVGLRRDLLTAAALGVDHLLFVYGDAPRRGERAAGMSVRRMLEVAREEAEGLRVAVGGSCTRELPGWKTAADDVLVQPCSDIERLVAWRERIDAALAVYPGVLVLGDAATGVRLNRTIPGLDVPEAALDRLDRDPDAGVELAAEQIDRLRATGAFDGLYLIPVGRHERLAERLRTARLAARPG
jgi:methylenetetrahydrofolate reductase (NADPH)